MRMSEEKRMMWTPKRKQEIALRLLKGESPQEIARELGLGMSTLYAWRDRFLEAGLEGLKYGGKSKALHETEEELRQARQTIGKLTMELELHEKKVRMEEARKKSSAGSQALRTRSR
jgi:transposase-like protein